MIVIRTPSEILRTGPAWISGAELEALCELAEAVREAEWFRASHESAITITSGYERIDRAALRFA